MVFSRKEFRRLNKFNRIYVLVSGGKDSTYTVLRLKELSSWIKRPVILLHTNTGNRLKSAKITLDSLDQVIAQQFSGMSRLFQWSSLVLEASAILPQKSMFYIKQSLLRIPEAERLFIKGKYSKKVFPCCYYLKHKPFEIWLRNEDHSNDVFISSIRPGESNQRQLFLAKLRHLKTHFWFHRRTKVWYYYPLRDTGFREVYNYLLQDQKFWTTKRSGCRICPILALFNLKSEGKRYINTLKVLKKIEQKVEETIEFTVPYVEIEELAIV